MNDLIILINQFGAELKIAIIGIFVLLLCQSCACAGTACSIGGIETHKALNNRLIITKSTQVVKGGQSWGK